MAQSLISSSAITNRKVYEVSLDTVTTSEIINHNLNTTNVAGVGISGDFSIDVIDNNSINVSLKGDSASCLIIVWV